MTKAKNTLEDKLQNSLSELIFGGGQIILQIDINTSVNGKKELKFSATSQMTGSPVVPIPQEKIHTAISTLEVTEPLVGFTITEEQQRNQKCVTIIKNKMSGKSAIPLNEVLTKLKANGKINDFNAIEPTLLEMRKFKNLNDMSDALIKGANVMFDVVSNKSIDDLKMLLETGMDIDQAILNESLIVALQSNTNPLEKVDLLLQYGANPQPSLSDEIVQKTPLYYALESENKPFELTKSLLTWGADADKACYSYQQEGALMLRKPLYYALTSKNDSLELTKLLLNNGAKVTVCDTFVSQETGTNMLQPLYYALKSENKPFELTELLLKNGGDANKICYLRKSGGNKTEITPLYYALESENKPFELTELLLKNGGDADKDYYTDINIKTSYVGIHQKQTTIKICAKPLFSALIASDSTNSFNCTKLLLENGADPTKPVRSKSTEEFRGVQSNDYSVAQSFAVDFVKSWLEESGDEYSWHKAVLLSNGGVKFSKELQRQINSKKNLDLDYKKSAKCDSSDEEVPFIVHEYIWDKMKLLVNSVKKLLSKESGDNSLQQKVETSADTSKPGVLYLTNESNRELPSQVPESPQPKASLWDKVLSCLNLFSWFGSGKSKEQSEMKVGENVGSATASSFTDKDNLAAEVRIEIIDDNQVNESVKKITEHTGRNVSTIVDLSTEALHSESPQPKASLLSKVLSCLNPLSWFGSGKSKGQSEAKVGTPIETKDETADSQGVPSSIPKDLARSLLTAVKVQGGDSAQQHGDQPYNLVDNLGNDDFSVYPQCDALSDFKGKTSSYGVALLALPYCDDQN